MIIPCMLLGVAPYYYWLFKDINADLRYFTNARVNNNDIYLFEKKIFFTLFF